MKEGYLGVREVGMRWRNRLRLIRGKAKEQGPNMEILDARWTKVCDLWHLDALNRVCGLRQRPTR